MSGLGQGLTSLAFWGFVAAVVVAGIWYSIRERQAQYETLSKIIDSGQPIDEAVVDRILGGGKRTEVGLKIAGLIVIFVAPGLAVLAWFIAQLSEPWLMPLLGAAALVGFVGLGLLVAARYVAGTNREEDASTGSRTL